MYLTKVQTLFKHQSHTEHPLLRKFGIISHFLHGHITVHYHRLIRTWQDCGFQKIKLTFHHFLDAKITFWHRKLKRQCRYFHFIKTYCLYVFVQVKLIKLIKKLFNSTAFYLSALSGMIAEQPFAYHFITLWYILYITFITAHKLCDRWYLCGSSKLPCSKACYCGDKAFRVGRLSSTVPYTENGGNIIIYLLAHTLDVYIKGWDKGIEILPHRLSVGRYDIFTVKKGSFYVLPCHIAIAFFPCHSLKSVAKPVKRHSVYLRYSLSASVSAKCWGRYPWQLTKLLCRAGKLFYILSKLFAKLHFNDPSRYHMVLR